MLKKRLIGIITVLNGWAVQSIGYKKYLPIGRPHIIAENLDRWGADEIIILSIDRSRHLLGPDKETLSSINSLSLSTPISYGGGITSVKEAVFVIKNGAERLVLDSLIKENSINEIIKISDKLGSQSLIASLPVIEVDKEIEFINYKNKAKKDKKFIYKLLNDLVFSEALIIDYKNEGLLNSFKNSIINNLDIPIPIIAFGGITEPEQVKNLLSNKKVAAIASGNSLNYREHAIQQIKKNSNLDCLREPKYYNFHKNNINL